VSRGRLELPTN